MDPLLQTLLARQSEPGGALPPGQPPATPPPSPEPLPHYIDPITLHQLLQVKPTPAPATPPSSPTVLPM